MADAIEFVDDPKAENIIELRNVSQSYDGGKTLTIDNLSLLIENGKNNFVSILGMSGCGKSTLLRYISGLQKPTSGTVLVNGKPISRQTIVGMVMQKYSSMPWMTVLENVALGLELQGVPQKEREERAMEMIQKVGLDGHEKKFAQYPILSGGQLQRVAIARSVLASPQILLMDEPFGALDIKTRLDMQDMVNRLIADSENQMTIIFITHDISEAVYLTDEVYIMQANPGRIVDRVHVDLPFERERGIKRTKKFLDTVYDIEDRMEDMIQKSKKVAKIKKGGAVEMAK
jgi:NitT/TauT family transport system ATP-binding protein